MGKIAVCGIELHAYHGCLEEESKLGGKYSVDVIVNADLLPGATSDELSKTVDYVANYNIVKKQMAIRSKLIETVARRIADDLQKLPGVQSGEIILRKLTAPIGGVVGHVAVHYSF